MSNINIDNAYATECESPSLQSDTDLSREFPGGEIETSHPTELGPLEAVNKFVGHRTASIHEAVLSTVAAAEAARAFEGDSAKSQQWLGNMVRVKALTKAEAAVGLASEKKSASNLSKLRKIAKYEHILRVPKIASLLPSGGFATLYECARLGELLEDNNPDTAVDELYRLLLEHEGPVTRDWLKKEGDKRRSPKPSEDTQETPEPESRPAEQLPEQAGDDRDSDDSLKAADRREDVVQSDAEEQIEEHDPSRDDSDDEELSSETAAVSVTPDISRLSESLVAALAVAQSTDDEAVLIVQGNLSSLLPIRKTLLKNFAASNLHLLAKGTSTGWDVVVCDSENGDLK